MMPSDDCRPNPKGKARNEYIGFWTEPACRPIPLAPSVDSLRQILQWGADPDNSPYTHQDIARWCSEMSLADRSDLPSEMEPALRIAEDVDAQWDLSLVNTYSIDQLWQLDFAAVRMPTEWFINWLRKLDRSEPHDAIEPVPPT